MQIISIWRGATDRANKPTGEQNGGSRTHLVAVAAIGRWHPRRWRGCHPWLCPIVAGGLSGALAQPGAGRPAPGARRAVAGGVTPLGVLADGTS